MQNFESFLVESNVVGYKNSPIVLKSGKLSSWYVNCRVLSQKLDVLEQTAKYVVEFIQNKNVNITEVDCVLGVPEGATELGNAVSRLLIKEGRIEDRIYLQRFKPKDHGDVANKFWTNGNVPKKVIVLEDVTTTGSSAISFVEKLKESGIETKLVIGLVNRLQLSGNESVIENFSRHNIEYISITDANLLLPKVLENIFDESLKSEIKNKIISEYRVEYQEAQKESPINF